MGCSAGGVYLGLSYFYGLARMVKDPEPPPSNVAQTETGAPAPTAADGNKNPADDEPVLREKKSKEQLPPEIKKTPAGEPLPAPDPKESSTQKPPAPSEKQAQPTPAEPPVGKPPLANPRSKPEPQNKESSPPSRPEPEPVKPEEKKEPPKQDPAIVGKAPPKKSAIAKLSDPIPSEEIELFDATYVMHAARPLGDGSGIEEFPAIVKKALLSGSNPNRIMPNVVEFRCSYRFVRGKPNPKRWYHLDFTVADRDGRTMQLAGTDEIHGSDMPMEGVFSGKQCLFDPGSAAFFHARLSCNPQSEAKLQNKGFRRYIVSVKEPTGVVRVIGQSAPSKLGPLGTPPDESAEFEPFPWTVPFNGTSRFSSTGELTPGKVMGVLTSFRYDLAELTGPGIYRQVDGVGAVLPDGKYAFYAGPSWAGKQKLVYTVTNGNDVKTYRFLLEVNGDPSTPVRGARPSKHVEANGRYVRRGNNVVLFHMPRPDGWVMTQDNVTLIIALGDQKQLVYFDTLKNVELQRTDVDFAPAALALQGKTLFAAAKNAAVVYALDSVTGKALKEFKLPEEAVHIACHPSDGVVYATTPSFDVFAMDPATGAAIKTSAKGQFIAVDPTKGDFVYTGLRTTKDDHIDLSGLDGKFRILVDKYGPRDPIMKFQVKGDQLHFANGQENAHSLAKSFHLSPDGKRVMLVGYGLRAKDDATTYTGTPVFGTDHLQTLLGKAPLGEEVRFHPVLNFGLASRRQGGFIQFNSTTFAETKELRVPNTWAVGAGHPEVAFLFGAKGTKLILWNDDDFNSGHGLYFLPLEFTPQERAILAKVYGKN